MPSAKICNLCGTQYPETERFCPRDGTPLRAVGGDQSDLIDQVVADRYHVIRKLGDGGMGQVYLAEHVKMGRRIALKVMKPAMMRESDAVSRFSREAANASRINHPNVAAVHDFGETDDGTIYIAMELVDGQSLRKLIEHEGALQATRVVNIIRQTADALAAAHELGIVHRDLKPDNIMIGRTRDGSDLVKVVDFGIAKAVGSDSQKVTKTGFVVGTPEFMSPEQLAGDKLDERSDIYSLGLVAFNMFTGALPFPSSTAQESMIMRLTDKPKSLADMRPDLPWPAAGQRVMDRVLDRDAATRFQSATEFSNALAMAFATVWPRPAGAAHTAPPQRVQVPKGDTVVVSTPPSRRRLYQAVAAVAVVVAIGGVLSRYVGASMRSGQKAGGDSLVIKTQLAGNTVTPQPPNDSSKPLRDSTRKGRSTSAPPAVARGNIGLRSPETPATTVKFSPVTLSVLVSGLPANIRQQVETVAKGVKGVSLVDDAAQSSDLVMRAEGTSLLVERTDGRRTPERLEAKSLVRSLADLFRFEVATRTLSTLETAEPAGELRFQVGDGKRVFRDKQVIRVAVRVGTSGGYLTLIDVDPSGALTVLYPSEEKDFGRLAPRKDVVFENDFSANLPAGNAVVRALITDKPLRLDRNGLMLVSPDGPALANTIRREVERVGARWSSVSIAYVVAP